MKRSILLFALIVMLNSCVEQVNTDPEIDPPCACCKNHDCGGFPNEDPMPPR